MITDHINKQISVTQVTHQQLLPKGGGVGGFLCEETAQ